MRTYIAEPLPTQLDPLIAEYLGRQFQAIQTVFMSSLIVPEVLELSESELPGAMCILAEPYDSFAAGLYINLKDENGDTAWKLIPTQ